MPGFLHLADVRALLALNHALAADPSLYAAGLFLAGKISIVLMILTLAAVWFWKQPQEGNVISSVRLPEPLTGESAAKPSRRISAELRAAMQPMVRKLTRRQSRAQVIVLAGVIVLTALLMWLLSNLFGVDRPFVTFLPVKSYYDAFSGMRVSDSFPGTHAAILAAFVVGMYYWNRTLASVWVGLAIVFNLAAIAVGFHYPSDVLFGTLIGGGLSYKLFTIYRREGFLYDAAQTGAVGFEGTNSPYCYFLYAFLIFLGFEFLMYFGHFIQVLEHIQGDVMRKFK